MRTFVEIPGGKLKRVANRTDGKHNLSRRHDEDEGSNPFGGREPQNHRRNRRVTRQLLRLKGGLEDADLQ